MDHAVPVKVLRELLLNASKPTLEIIDSYMRSLYRLGAITRSEDGRLNDAGLRSRMPEGWTAQCSPYARYEAAGITAQQLRSDK
ncbi:hypothetical protein GGQ97_001559 [Sphingomonas kaistensis]|uniref:Uncharacterized protein n=1 Tax=Sphingomonas kaistensis TaxID=298708 RepID=A0A7X6BH60_9SPHN|nr:hypothetical protein [Sphingomonas kaistensis]NJC05766.1 hypothetical protein [Sphingomonas kaistensis]